MDQRISLLIDNLLLDLRRGWTARKMAAAIGMSLGHFQQIFRTETGKTPINFLREVRLEKAGTLLTATSLNIKEVRTEVGINDHSHFCRDFRKKYGLSPTDYRALKGSKQAKTGSCNGK